MDVIIHRGTHQIGGCSTEYRTKNTRILIDFGAELDSESAEPFDIEGVTKGKSDCDAVFFTHYHGDHIGLLDTINPDIPLYMGEISKAIAKILNDRLSKSPHIKSHDVKRVEEIKTFKAARRIQIGDICITPFVVDHSAYDAYMFLIEADGKRVLHTGDFRAHGPRGKGLGTVLEKYVKGVDVVVCEGTTLSRAAAKPETENELKYRIKSVLEENKYVFVVCSSTNIDRIAEICSAVPMGKYCLCDRYQYEVIELIRKTAGEKSPLYKFGKILYYDKNLDDKMLERGFCMFIRANNPAHEKIMETVKDFDPVVVYSMWKGYLEQDDIKKFLDGYRRVDMHTSGHADIDTIKKVIDTLNPSQIIPIHTETPEAFLKIAKDKVVLAEDGEVISIGG